MLSTRQLITTAVLAMVLAACLGTGAARVPEQQEALDTMRHATTFMVERAAVNGGYVWSYLPDFSRCWGEPGDLGGAAVFLASRASDYVHGTLIPVDGGWLAR